MRGRQWDLSNGTKPCPSCGESKEFSAFGTSKYSASGLSAYCKVCTAEKARAYRATPEGKKRHYESTTRWIEKLPGQAETEGSKTCPSCKEHKPFAQFPKNRRGKHGINVYCLTCAAQKVRDRRATPEGQAAHRAASKRWREANTERNKDNHAKWNYGIEHGTYDTLLAKQDSKCAICRTTEPGSRLNRFPIDHCHTSGKVRGLLCENCNRGLGLFQDNKSLLSNAIAYLTLAEGGGESGG